ncbi:hypothetical protein HPP92_025410 [Vanilla planifolia]|uniref:Uncharacterized protein n=1 Tax=Vanilla planifolia TaxID=51239 RepID=A0A835UCA8_VANPL|nr:hypothetical protein HPP92_025410 [Vanilla planifolia]
MKPRSPPQSALIFVSPSDISSGMQAALNKTKLVGNYFYCHCRAKFFRPARASIDARPLSAGLSGPGSE